MKTATTIYLVMHVLFPGESTWEEASRAPVASFAECRATARALVKQTPSLDSLPYFTECVDTSLTPQGRSWMIGEQKEKAKVAKKKTVNSVQTKY